jgi:hypothetical protein
MSPLNPVQERAYSEVVKNFSFDAVLTATAASDRRNPDRPDTHTVGALLHQPADARIHDQLPPLFATEATQRISFGFSRVGGRW